MRLIATAGVVAFTSSIPTLSSIALAQQLELRRMTGGLIQVQATGGLKLVIQPDSQTVAPKSLQAHRSFVLGSEFEPTLMQADGNADVNLQPLKPGDKIPPSVVSVDSVLIGTKQAGIQLRTGNLNVLFGSVELMSDQGWITTHHDQQIHLLVLTFKDAARLQTA